jgi:hypothetical protein
MLELLLNKNVWIALAITIGLSIFGYKAYSFGYDHASSKYNQLIAEINRASAKEADRQIEIHDKITELQQAQIVSLQQTKDDLNKKLEENKVAAHKDPNANNPAINRAGILRLNAIR